LSHPVISDDLKLVNNALESGRAWAKYARRNIR